MWLLILLLVNAKHEVTFIRSAGELNMGTEYQTLLFMDEAGQNRKKNRK